jgi:hypothetical protein
MRSSSLKTAVVFLLAFSIAYTQVVQSFAGSKEKKVKVAFVGIKFEGIENDVQTRILEKVTRILASQWSLQLLKPEEVQAAVGAEKVAEILNTQDKASFVALAEELGVEYVFAGILANNSRDPNRILLDGEIKRFHRATQGILSFEVLTYYENLEIELWNFKKDYLDTIVATKEAGKSREIWPLVILGGLAVAGIVAFKAVGLSSPADREEPEPPVD